MRALRQIRKELGMSQQELADSIGVGRTTVTMWETGANTPPTKMLKVLAKVLGCTVDELLHNEADDTD